MNQSVFLSSTLPENMLSSILFPPIDGQIETGREGNERSD